MKSPVLVLIAAIVSTFTHPSEAEAERLRVVIETDAGGDPDDEQSFARWTRAKTWTDFIRRMWQSLCSTTPAALFRVRRLGCSVC